AAASAAYKSNVLYISSTLAAYQAANTAAQNAAAAATDDDFYQKLTALAAASMNYANMFLSSTFGTQIPNALDNTPDTFVVYTQAQNLTHYFDFGPNFKISA